MTKYSKCIDKKRKLYIHNKIKQLNCEIKQYTNEYKKYVKVPKRKKIDKCKKKIDNIRKYYIRVKNKIQKKLLELQNLHGDNDPNEYLQEIKRLTDVNEDLKEQYNDLLQQRRDLQDEADRKIDDLTTENKDYKLSITQCEDELKRLTDEFSAREEKLRNKIQEYKDRGDEDKIEKLEKKLEEEREQFLDQKKGLDDIIDENQKEYQETVQKFETEIQNHKNKIDEKEQEIKNYISKQQLLDTEIKDLKSDLKKVDQDYENLNKQKQELQKKYDNIEKKIKEQEEKYTIKKEKLKTDYKGCQQKLSECTDTLTQKNNEIEEIKRILQDKINIFKKNIEKVVSNLDNDVKINKTTIKKILDNIDEEKESFDTLISSINEEYNKIKETKNKKQEEQKDLLRKIEETKVEFNDIKQKLDNELKKKEQNKEKIRTLREELLITKKGYDELVIKNEEYKKNLEDCVKKEKKLINDKKLLSDTQDILIKERDNLENFKNKVLNKQKSFISKYENEFKNLDVNEDFFKVIDKYILELKNYIEEQTKKYETLTDKYSSDLKQNTEEKNDIEKITEEKNKIQRDFTLLKEKSKNRKDEITKLTVELKTLNEEKEILKTEYKKNVEELRKTNSELENERTNLLKQISVYNEQKQICTTNINFFREKLEGCEEQKNKCLEEKKNNEEELDKIKVQLEECKKNGEEKINRYSKEIEDCAEQKAGCLFDKDLIQKELDKIKGKYSIVKKYKECIEDIVNDTEYIYTNFLNTKTEKSFDKYYNDLLDKYEIKKDNKFMNNIRKIFIKIIESDRKYNKEVDENLEKWKKVQEEQEELQTTRQKIIEPVDECDDDKKWLEQIYNRNIDKILERKELLIENKLEDEYENLRKCKFLYENKGENENTYCQKLKELRNNFDEKIFYKVYTNIIEDKLGAVRTYVRFKKPFTKKLNKQICNDNKIRINCVKEYTNNLEVVDCKRDMTELEGYGTKEFGPYYSIFDGDYKNFDIYCGVKDMEKYVDKKTYKIDDYNKFIGEVEQKENKNSTGLYRVINQVNDGYSIVIFGYGLSGSGKTYSLTGDDKTGGIIQYGLANLQNVKKIELKYLFEQYMGKVDLPFNKIDGKIRCFYNKNLLDTFLEGKKTFQEISSYESAGINEIVGKFNKNNEIKDLMTVLSSIDKDRRTLGTIKETPNNKQSSRSNMYYIFEIKFNNGKTGYLTFIDMAGKESPSEILDMYDSKIKTVETAASSANTDKNLRQIISEGIHINENIQHMLAFFNKKIDKKYKHPQKTSNENYSEDKTVLSYGKSEMKFLLDKLDTLSEGGKMTKYVMLCNINQEQDKCDSTLKSLELINNIKSSQ